MPIPFLLKQRLMGQKNYKTDIPDSDKICSLDELTLQNLDHTDLMSYSLKHTVDLFGFILLNTISKMSSIYL